MLAGSDSPAVTVARTVANTLGSGAASSMAAQKPGLEKNSVGASASISFSTAAGDGDAGFRIAVAPAARGNVSELPSPYAKNSLATERKRSFSLTRNTSRAYVS